MEVEYILLPFVRDNTTHICLFFQVLGTSFKSRESMHLKNVGVATSF